MQHSCRARLSPYHTHRLRPEPRPRLCAEEGVFTQTMYTPMSRPHLWELHSPEQRHQAWLTLRTRSPLHLFFAGFWAQPATLSPGENHCLPGRGMKGEGSVWTERDKAGGWKALTSQETLSFLAVYVCVSQPASLVCICAHLPPAYLSCDDPLTKPPCRARCGCQLRQAPLRPLLFALPCLGGPALHPSHAKRRPKQEEKCV